MAAWPVERVSEASLNALGAVSGINDVDAITLATSNPDGDGAVAPAVGARAILPAAIVNTAVKGGLAVWLGGRALGVRAGGVLGGAVVLGGVAWFLISAGAQPSSHSSIRLAMRASIRSPRAGIRSTRSRKSQA